MAISLVSGGNLAQFAQNGADATIIWPTLQEGDVTYVLVARRSTPALTTTGYTEIASINSSSITAKLFRKVQGASPDANVVATGSGNTSHGMEVIGFALRGVDTTTPEDATPTTNNNNGTDPNGPSITTVTPNAWVISFAASEVHDLSVTTPSGYSNSVNGSASDTNSASAAGATKEVATPGAEDPGAWTNWLTGFWCGITAAVRPQLDGQQALLVCFP